MMEFTLGTTIGSANVVVVISTVVMRGMMMRKMMRMRTMMRRVMNMMKMVMFPSLGLSTMTCFPRFLPFLCRAFARLPPPLRRRSFGCSGRFLLPKRFQGTVQ